MVSFRHRPEYQVLYRSGQTVSAYTCDSTQNTIAEGNKLQPSSSLEAPKKQRQWPADVITKFNTSGSCSFGSRCKFKHTCGDCSGDHPAKSCPSKSKPDMKTWLVSWAQSVTITSKNHITYVVYRVRVSSCHVFTLHRVTPLHLVSRVMSPHLASTSPQCYRHIELLFS